MNGLTSRQEWTHDHIVRCTCGSWMVVTDRQLRLLAEDFRPACPHIRAVAMESA